MPRIRIAVHDHGADSFTEVEGYYVAGTHQLFAVRQVDHSDQVLTEDFIPGLSLVWTAWHVPSGQGVITTHSRREVTYVASQLYQAAPDAWTLPDAKEVLDALPPAVLRWGSLVRIAARLGMPLELLKSCGEFVRDATQANTGKDT